MNAVLPLNPSSRGIACDFDEVAVFSTALGWIALVARAERLVRLVFGYPSARAVRDALAIASKAAPEEVHDSPTGNWTASLRDRLDAYAAGQADDFADVRVWSEDWTPFQQNVLACCRRIPFGQTRTYAELAIAAGSPGAARAVGRTMATNPVPLVIPCHRVVGSGGDLRGFSAFGGLDAKRQLLALERAAAMPLD